MSTRESELLSEVIDEVKTFDFRRSDALRSADLDNFQAIATSFGREFAAELSTFFRQGFSITVGGIRQAPWNSYTKACVEPGCFLVLRARNLGVNAVLEFGTPLLFNLLETLLGFSGGAQQKTSRELTGIEKKLLSGVFRSAERHLNLAWQNGGPQFEQETLSARPTAAYGMAHEEPVVITEFLVKSNAMNSHMCLSVPAPAVRSHRQNSDKNGAGVPKSGSRERSTDILQRLKRSAVEITANLESSGICLTDLATLEVGDVLNLGCPLEKPLSLKINGTAAYSGLILPERGKRTFAIQKIGPEVSTGASR